MNFQTTKDELADVLSEAGEVVEVAIPTDRMTGRPRGFAFAEFGSAEAAEKAIELFDGKEVGGRPLRVNLAEERARRGPGGGGSFSGPPPDFGSRGGYGGGGGYGGAKGGGKNKGSRRGLRGKKRSL